jgi:hypothetical protein
MREIRLNGHHLGITSIKSLWPPEEVTRCTPCYSLATPLWRIQAVPAVSSDGRSQPSGCSGLHRESHSGCQGEGRGFESRRPLQQLPWSAGFRPRCVGSGSRHRGSPPRLHEERLRFARQPHDHRYIWTRLHAAPRRPRRHTRLSGRDRQRPRPMGRHSYRLGLRSQQRPRLLLRRSRRAQHGGVHKGSGAVAAIDMRRTPGFGFAASTGVAPLGSREGPLVDERMKSSTSAQVSGRAEDAVEFVFDGCAKESSPGLKGRSARSPMG